VNVKTDFNSEKWFHDINSTETSYMTHKCKTFQHIGVLKVLCVLCLLSLTKTAAAQDPDTAFVPFIVNVKVKAVQGTDTVEINVTANKADTLKLPLGKTTSVRYKTSQNGQQGSAGVIINNNRGKISLNLPVQGYKSADISLYSVNGKRVLRGKASASEAGKSISRPNLVAGVYLLTVKGGDGQSFSNRVTHRGGSFSIGVSFGGNENAVNSLSTMAVSAFSESDAWGIKISANGYADSVYQIVPSAGVNPLQAITLSIVESQCGETGHGHFNSGISYGCFTDTRAGANNQSYRTVVIGGKTWFAENLNYAGESNNVGVCYLNSADSCAKYGRLYTWTEAMKLFQHFQNTLWNGSDVNHQGVCPVGWRLPNDNDWNDLMTAVGGSSTAGSKLKSQTGWRSYSGISSTDEFGFSALPGGYGNGGGNFINAGNRGFWWSATEDDARDARYRIMHYDYDNVIGFYNYKNYQHSLRCLSD